MICPDFLIILNSGFLVPLNSMAQIWAFYSNFGKSDFRGNQKKTGFYESFIFKLALLFQVFHVTLD
jgi:hypothetical protein